MAEISRENYRRLIGLAGLLALVLTAFFAVKTINEIKRFGYIGEDSMSNMNSISVSGEGEVFAVADIASFSYSVVESGSTVGDAESKATQKWNEILSYLREQGIEDADIKTTNYAVDPQYAPLAPNTAWVPMVEREITGYTVTQTAQIKVRDTDNVGSILSSVGERGVRNLSGISFTIDDMSVLETEARELAIADAKAKADVLAKNLGVRLDGVTSYYEVRGGYYPMPAYAEREMMSFDGMGAGMVSSSPEIPMGENRIVVNVEVSYRIR